jgi:hypothetical protein
MPTIDTCSRTSKMGVDARRKIILEPLLRFCNDIATIIVTEFYSPWCEGMLNGGETCGGLKTSKTGDRIGSKFLLQHDQLCIR